MAKLNVQIKGLKQFTRALSQYPNIASGYFATAIQNATWQLKRATKRRTPVGESGLLRSTMGHSFSPTVGKVFPTREYAGYVHQGTSGHTIQASSAQALYWKGAAHPVKSVYHPGTKAQPFLEWGIADANSEIGRTFEKALENILNEIAKKS